MLANLEVYLQEIMRNVAASLMVPVMIVLVLLILFSVYSVGAIVAEFLMERRHFKANAERDINAIKAATFDELPDVIESTGLLRRQKEALKVIAANIALPEDDLFALAKSEVTGTDARYRRRVGRTDLVTKIAPMMGLMCTLIPLGPGIVAMGQGEVNLLSNSLLVAFDGTVAGLIGGVVSMVVSALRKRWYAEYLVEMESLATSVLEKASELEGRKAPGAGAAPEGYAQSFAGADPFGSVPMAQVPLGGVLVDAGPVAAAPAGAVPVTAPAAQAPMGTVQMGTVPADAVQMGAVPAGGAQTGTVPFGQPVSVLDPYGQPASGAALGGEAAMWR